MSVIAAFFTNFSVMADGFCDVPDAVEFCASAGDAKASVRAARSAKRVI
jgi:hypothetical protein